MVQLRDENHKPLPGVELGILGRKMGTHGSDTGYLILKDVRIPRMFMLMGNNKVSPDGTFSTNPEAGKFHYSTMLFTRAHFVRSGA